MMAMRRESEVQGELVVTWAEMPRSPSLKTEFFNSIDRRPEVATRGSWLVGTGQINYRMLVITCARMRPSTAASKSLRQRFSYRLRGLF
jgi:hypothetical protein